MYVRGYLQGSENGRVVTIEQKKDNRHTMADNILHRKLKIEQHKPDWQKRGYTRVLRKDK